MKSLFQLLCGSRRRVKEADRLLQMAGEGGSHTHCVVAVMGRMDFWLKDYYGTPKSWVHPLPRHQVSRPSRFCLLWSSGCELPLWLTKNTDIVRRALPPAHICTKSSCGVGISYTEVLISGNIEFWPRQGSDCAEHCAKTGGKKLKHPLPILPKWELG